MRGEARANVCVSTIDDTGGTRRCGSDDYWERGSIGGGRVDGDFRRGRISAARIDEDPGRRMAEEIVDKAVGEEGGECTVYSI